MTLLPHHAEMLRASAISDEIIAERGYYSTEEKSELKRIGFTASALHVPTLVIPIHGVVAGEAPWHMHRPDVPRVRDGRQRKYEIPYRAKLKLDIHPRAREYLANPDYPLFFTEGSKKADALVSAGARAVVGFPGGVFGFRGRNEDDGLAILGDWEWVHLREGRLVYAVFDSDILLKQEVARAMNRMGVAMQRMGAEVAYTRLPSDEGGMKAGADDFLAAGHSLDDIVALSRPDPPKPTERTERSVKSPARAGFPRSGGDRTQTERGPNALAFEPRILDRLDAAMGELGLVGERHVARSVRLVHTSRMLSKPARAIVKGDSSTGKSFAAECALKTAAPEELWVRTSTSPLALFYSEEDFRHRTLVFYEASKLGDPDDPLARVLRTLISEDKLSYEVTDSQQRTTEVLEKEGPVAFISTIAKATLEPEIETRILSLHSDGSDEMTRKVVRDILLGSADTPAELDLSEWHELDRWLATGPRNVVVPWGPALATFDLAGPPRLRRDVSNLLALVRAHTLLHRATRALDSRGQLVATLEDYAVVRALLADTLAVATDKAVRPGTRKIVEAVAALRDGRTPPATVSAAAAAKQAGRSKSTTHTDVHDALDRGYLVNRATRESQFDLAIGDPLPDQADLLPSRDELVGGIRALAAGAFGRRSVERSPPDRTRNPNNHRAFRRAFGPFGRFGGVLGK